MMLLLEHTLYSPGNRYRLTVGRQVIPTTLSRALTSISLGCAHSATRLGPSMNRESAQRLEGQEGKHRSGQDQRHRLVPQTGLEPVTPSLRMTCSTN